MKPKSNKVICGFDNATYAAIRQAAARAGKYIRHWAQDVLKKAASPTKGKKGATKKGKRPLVGDPC